MTKDGVYIDLFDDGIPQKNLLIESNERGSLETRLAHTARFQILLCLLFGRSVLVPEAWLVSSPTFLRIAQEIEEHYSPELEERDSIGARFRPSPPVFLVSFFDEVPAPLPSKYLQAFARRLDDSRRIECLTGVLQAHGDVAKDQRRHLAAFLRKWIPASDVVPVPIDHFQRALAEFLLGMAEGPGATDRAWTAARAISGVLRYLDSKPATFLDVPWGIEGERRYRTHMAEQVKRVQTVVSLGGGRLNDHTAQLQAFQSFFAEVAQKQIQFTDVMGMSRLLVNYDPAVAQTVSAFGRYVLNRGYASGVQSPHAGMSFNFYAQGSASEFNLALMSAVLNEERRTTWADYPGFLQLAHGREYDLADTIDWPATWKACAAVVNDPKWAEKRKKISDRLMKHDDTAQLGDDLWEDLFDRVNGEFLDLRFKFSGGEGKVISRMKKLVAVGKDNITPDSMTLIGGMESGAASVASLGVPSVAGLLIRLVDMVPGRTLIKGERLLRRLGIPHHSEVSLHASSADLLRS